MSAPHSPTMATSTLTKILLLSIVLTGSDCTSEQVLPHITDCFSANMETFRCQWSHGSLHNLSEPGDLRLFYIRHALGEWMECPDYSTDRHDECFFNANHTYIWTSYRVQLRSRDQTVVYDESNFQVYDRVRPDPPYNLSWALLNTSVSGQYYDIMVNWIPPESADVKSGWMRLNYELQHRDTSTNVWKVSDILESTHSSVFGLHTNTNYEVRVRCKAFGAMKFGGFSDSIYVYTPSKVFRFPVAALLIFGALCLVAILMLVIISQQEKLMVLLLPPIPGPKIRGIDPELLKKGKLRELTSILGPSDVRPELYTGDPWVEFIELDLEEQHDMLTHLDTHCLVPGSLCAHDSPNSTCFRDDDSGRASCCDPDLHSDAENSPFHPNTTEQINQPQEMSASSPLINQAMYTQVSEVRPSGNVVLSPEEAKENKSVKDMEQKRTDIFVADSSGYTMEPGKINQSEGNVGTNSFSMNTENALLPPAPVYTVVESVDMQNSLLLNPSFPHLMISKPMPEGYLTPELFGSITP